MLAIDNQKDEHQALVAGKPKPTEAPRRDSAAAEPNPVQSLGLIPGGLQAKLAVSQPGDPYEQEADRVADGVMRMPQARVQRKCDGCSETTTPDEEEEKAGPVRLKAEGQSGFSAVSSSRDLLRFPAFVLSRGAEISYRRHPR